MGICNYGSIVPELYDFVYDLEQKQLKLLVLEKIHRKMCLYYFCETGELPVKY